MELNFAGIWLYDCTLLALRLQVASYCQYHADCWKLLQMDLWKMPKLSTVILKSALYWTETIGRQMAFHTVGLRLINRNKHSLPPPHALSVSTSLHRHQLWEGSSSPNALLFPSLPLIATSWKSLHAASNAVGLVKLPVCSVALQWRRKLQRVLDCCGVSGLKPRW